MNWMLILPVFLGLASVAQGGLNKRMIQYWSLTPTVIVNNFTLMVVSLIVYAAARIYPQYIPETFRIKEAQVVGWWYLIPGVLGYCLVAGIPYFIAQIGAAKVFLGLIAAQLIGGLVWDYLFEGQEITKLKVIGTVVVIIGAFISMWPQEKG